MNMKFYIGGVEVQTQTAPIFSETLDETLDSGSCILGFSTREKAYEPDTAFQIVDDDSFETLDYVIVSDMVEVVDKATPLYRHSITFVQRSRLLAKHTLRNMVFSQPSTQILKANQCSLYEVDYVDNEWVLVANSAGSYQTAAVIGKRAKVRKAWLEVQVFGVDNDTNPSTITELDPAVFSVTISVDIVGGGNLFTGSCGVGRTELDIAGDIAGGNNISITQGTTTTTASQYNTYNKVIMHFRLYLETYNYTLYDVLQKIQRVKRQRTNLHANSDLFTLPTSGDFYDALQEVAPQFTFTQMSVYEALDQVAKYLDGVITLSSTNVLGIEYFNNLSGATAFTSGKADQTSTISEDTYINGLISNYQNARAKEPVWYPSQNGYEISKSSILGIATTQTRVAHTSEPIESIEKFIVLVTFQSTVIGASLDFTDIEVDMTDYVVEKSIYDILPSTTDEFYNGDSSIKTNYNTVFYE
ncbi:MAG: hypothetical protein M0R51_10835, partial [Clostridia bacterium]|nr:hypothetical protein [Clostridia bacterium]